MSDALLLLDVPNLVWRAYHSLGALKSGGVVTGALFGFFRDLDFLAEQLNSSRLVFCFDRGIPLRRDDYPQYKANRRRKLQTVDPVYLGEEELKKEVRQQIGELRDNILPTLGFANVLSEDGYEADDVIASLCLHTLGEDEVAVLVSSDKDLYQLLSPHVSIYNPNGKQNRHVTLQSFTRDYGIKPSQWCDVKALSGCDSDNVSGVEGVGEKTALKYLLGKLPHTYKAHDKIQKGKGTWELNLDLVRLPYAGCPVWDLGTDRPDLSAWEALCDKMGFHTLRRHFPGRKRRGAFQIGLFK